MYMDLHLTALREPGTPPTQLRFADDEHTSPVVFFPTEGQSNAITSRYGTHVGPIHDALVRAVRLVFNKCHHLALSGSFSLFTQTRMLGILLFWAFFF
jgi:hypothetical protein